MNNIPAGIDELINKQLPTGAVVVDTISVNETTSALIVERNGVQERVPLIKRNIGPLFDLAPAVVAAEQNELMDVVVGRLSDIYRLSLIKDLDYGYKTQRVDFKDNSSISFMFNVKADSVLNSGSCLVTVYDKSKTAFCNLPEKDLRSRGLPLFYERYALALSTTILSNPDGDVFSGKRYTRRFSEIITDRLRLTGLVVNRDDMIENIALGEVLMTTNDGISDLAVSVTRDGTPYYVRYKERETEIV